MVYPFRLKSCRIFFIDEATSTYLSLKEQNCWLITCHTISSDAIFSFPKLQIPREQKCRFDQSRPAAQNKLEYQKTSDEVLM